MHDKSITQTLSLLSTSANNGLTNSQVEYSRTINGSNIISSGKQHTILQRFASQFADLMIVILLVSAMLSFVLACIEGDSFFEPIIIVAIVLANAILGTCQQVKADKALEKLSTLSSTYTIVIREGVTKSVPTKDIVVGDVILLDSGDVVPADCRMIEGSDVKVNQSMLTGESIPQDKVHNKLLTTNTTVTNRDNCLFSGTFVVAGRCKAVVYHVGNNTEMGNIASMLHGKTTKSPLEIRLAQLSKVIGIVCLIVCGVVLSLGLFNGIRNMSSGDSITQIFMSIFMTSVSLAVAAIPEGLPAVVTVVLARGVSRMASRNAIVKSLSAVETLGSASVVCSDKTGTLTIGKMSLVNVVTDKGILDLDQLDKEAVKALSYYCYCSNVRQGNDGYYGDPTEVAVAEYCDQHNINSSAMRLYELPFDSTRKMMTVIVKIGGVNYAITKGALDVMDNGGKFTKQYQQLSDKGLRVLALSVKEMPSNYITGRALESNLNVVALIAMADTIRHEARDSIQLCNEAGIKVIMVTGDSLNTAIEISSQLGIYRQGDRAIDGTTLASMSQEELGAVVDKISVFARVTPKDKLKIVKALQSRGYVTAMTGDGVNDAPALKQSDIGCAMGIGGTDVAKEASDMILTDDNFATIVEAVAEGRTVYDNIKKSVWYLLSCNIGEVLCVLIAMILWNVTPLFAMQLLWVNLVTDGLPSLALGIDKRDKCVMCHPPKSKDETFFSGGQGRRIAIYGVIFGLVTVIAYAIGREVDSMTANTMAFLVLSLSQLFFALEVASTRSLLVSGLSKVMIISFVISVLLVVVVALIPSIMTAFGLVYLTSGGYWTCLLLAIVPLVVGEVGILTKYALSKYKK